MVLSGSIMSFVKEIWSSVFVMVFVTELFPFGGKKAIPFLPNKTKINFKIHCA